MDLDNPQSLKEKDTHSIADSIGQLPSQIRQVLADSHLIKIPAGYEHVNKIVVNGMGGSNIGAYILKYVFADRLNVPMEICPGYEAPAYADEKTLYILSSYSGNTEEVLSIYDEIKGRGAKILGITAGGEDKGKLERLMIEDDIPGFIFAPENNVSGQPRMGLGYSVFGMLFLLEKSGLIEVGKTEIQDVIHYLEERSKELNIEAGKEKNEAKLIAKELSGKQTVLVGAEFLTGNLHAFRNQLCENSKNFSCYFTLPDLNHFLLESLANPESNKDQLAFLFFDSDLYHERTQKRSGITAETVKKNGIRVVNYKMKAKNKLQQSAELLQLGSWISFYLGMKNEVDPGDIPWVDWFKQQLK
jgi:glucose/mannose-6-phosphate isomerase